MGYSLTVFAVFAILFSGTGCARRDNPLKDALPVQIQLEWVLRETRTEPNEQAPDPIRNSGLKRWANATYRARGTINVRVFQMNAEASAFEMLQKWRKTDGLVFYKGPYFVVVDSSDVNRQMLAEFTQELQAQFKT